MNTETLLNSKEVINGSVEQSTEWRQHLQTMYLIDINNEKESMRMSKNFRANLQISDYKI